MIYFDNAATSWPKPRSTVEAANAVFSRYGANPGRGGHKMAMDTSKMVFTAREQLSALLGGEEAENVIFTLNCTHAVNLAVKGCLHPGDHVVLSSMEHNAVWRPVENLLQRGMIEYDIARVEPSDPAATVRHFKESMRKNTRLVCCVHGSNVFGTIQPVEEICRMAHEAGALFLLDAAQTAGVLEIDLHKLPADFVCIAAHKGLYAPTALGALLVNGGETLATVIEGGSGSLSMESTMPPFLPDRLEAGTVNTTGICGLIGGLRFVKARGIRHIYREEMALCHQLYRGLETLGGVVLYNKPALRVLSFGVRGMTGEAVANALAEKGFALRGGFHCSPLAHRTMGTEETGTVRAGMGAFNNGAQVQALVRAVAQIARSSPKG